MLASLMLAHQSGWDDIAYFVVPTALAILALRWSAKRATRQRTHEQTNTPDDNEMTNRSQE